MPVCPAIVRTTNTPCTIEGKNTYGGFCGKHKNQHPPLAAALAEATAVTRETMRDADVRQDRGLFQRRVVEMREAQMAWEREPNRETEAAVTVANDALRAAHEMYAERLRTVRLAVLARRGGGAVPLMVPAAVAAAEVAAAAAAEYEAEAAVAAARNDARAVLRAAKNTELLARCPNLTVSEYQRIAASIGILWMEAPLPNHAIVAYKALRHSPIHEPALPTILRACLELLFLTKKYHPHRTEYAAVPDAEKRVALDRLAAAVTPLLPPEVTEHFLPVGDPMEDNFKRRFREEQLALERQIREREAAAFALRLQQEVVVFRRDPEGSVDLRAFAADPQSVHRSSVQTATERSVRLLLERGVPEFQNTLAEVAVCFRDPEAIRWRTPELQVRALQEITKDYYEVVAFAVRYGDVLDRVWAFVQHHAETRELIIRLAQEVLEGFGMCTNGKMARLVNVLQGYDETLFVAQAPLKEAFQERMARLRGRPVAERGPAAAALFEEYAIAEGERGAWREALAE